MNFIGIDVGTSSIKALLVDPTGNVLATSNPEYPFQTPAPLCAETDPDVWWDATCKAIRELLAVTDPELVSGIGLTGQMHGLVLIDEKGAPLRPCIMWNDQRSFQECEEMTEIIGAAEVLRITGNPVLAGFTAPKLRWVEKNEPEIFAKISKVLLPKDFIRYRLTGEFFSEMSDASGTSMLNVGERKWSEEILEAMGWSISWLPELTESTVASAKISSDASARTGLIVNTPVVAGGGDQAAQAVGCGIVEEGMVSATLGTSGVVFAQSDEYRVEPDGKLHAFCHAVPGKWHLMGVMLSAAGSFQWYKNQLGEEEQRREQNGEGNAYDLLTHAAAAIDPGCEGLLFLPYLSGERTPYPDPHAKGAFVGMTLRHGKAHLTRAVLEGVSYGLKDSLSLMQALGVQPAKIILSGGGARSELWKQMLSDIFETPCCLVNATEGAAYGAALLAAVGCGALPTVEDASRAWIRETQQIGMGANSPKYKKNYRIYQDLYPSLKNAFYNLSEQ
ncbi:MAG: xylulokinase [Opitutae bacterium]